MSFKSILLASWKVKASSLQHHCRFLSGGYVEDVEIQLR